MIVFYKRIRFVQLNRNPSILIRRLKNKTNIVNVYINDFLLALDRINIFKMLKKFLWKKYNIKNFGKIKTIIGQ